MAKYFMHICKLGFAKARQIRPEPGPAFFKADGRASGRVQGCRAGLGRAPGGLFARRARAGNELPVFLLHKNAAYINAKISKKYFYHKIYFYIIFAQFRVFILNFKLLQFNLEMKKMKISCKKEAYSFYFYKPVGQKARPSARHNFHGFGPSRVFDFKARARQGPAARRAGSGGRPDRAKPTHTVHYLCKKWVLYL